MRLIWSCVCGQDANFAVTLDQTELWGRIIRIKHDGGDYNDNGNGGAIRNSKKGGKGNKKGSKGGKKGGKGGRGGKGSKPIAKDDLDDDMDSYFGRAPTAKKVPPHLSPEITPKGS